MAVREITRVMGCIGGAAACGAAIVLGAAAWMAAPIPSHAQGPPVAATSSDNAPETQLSKGKLIFRHDTFGDEQLWTDTLRMHEVIQSAIDPVTALSLGLKVDSDALPDEVLLAILERSIWRTRRRRSCCWNSRRSWD